MHCRKWRFSVFFPGFSYTSSYWYAKQRISFIIIRNLFHFGIINPIDFAWLLSTARIFSVGIWKYANRKVSYLYTDDDTAEISQASSCDVLLCRCGLPLNSLNHFAASCERLFSVVMWDCLGDELWVVSHSYEKTLNQAFFQITPIWKSLTLANSKFTKSENLIKKNLFYTCNGA